MEVYMIEKGIYKHYKGNVYKVIGEAIHSETLEEMVVYTPITNSDKIWVRPVSMWNDTIIINGEKIKRFTKVERKTKKVLVVIDMQNDFIDGSLGSLETKPVVEIVSRKIAEFDGDMLIYTLDTHDDNYLKTAEGIKLPVKHCIKGTIGHQLCASIKESLATVKCDVIPIEKHHFGTFDYKLHDIVDGDDIELCGLCTDICLIANAVILKTMFPNSTIHVSSQACAGVTRKLHEEALDVMRSLQIIID